MIGRKKRKNRIQALTHYLAAVNSGNYTSILPDVEDEFSCLEDEIYKTITELRTAKENALKEKQNFAESLANIAHQIKTPAASLSVSAQLLKGKLDERERRKLTRQINQICQLTDALLTISRIDAGVLELKKNPIDVYTLLVLSAEALDDPIKEKNIHVVLPNHPEVSFVGDLDWSVEAFINLIKNSLEHMSDYGMLHFEYAQNPLYTEITIQDNGEGFNGNEIPHLFRRFYQGNPHKGSGTGIGLSISKSIIEMQNGFIQAKNMPQGGACFSIRFYRH
jgi:signal transduction histidine kinase